MSFFSSLFDPFPPALEYSDPLLLPFLLIALGLLAASYFLSRLSRNHPNPVTKKLTKIWPKAAFFYGFVALILVVSRAEAIQYIAMQFWWIVWAILGILFATVQYRLFRSRHYQVLKSEHVEDPREKYLPKRKR